MVPQKNHITLLIVFIAPPAMFVCLLFGMEQWSVGEGMGRVKPVLVLLFLSMTVGVEISVDPMCGKSLPTCPNRIGLKVVGGSSSCAEKVPWNVLIVRRDRRMKRQSSGN